MAELAMSNEDGLTEEERAALNEDIGDENVVENKNSNDSGTGEVVDAGSTDTDPDHTPADDESPSRDDGTDPDAGNVEVDPLAGSQEQNQSDASQQPATILEVEGVAEAQALLAELPAKKETLLQQFDDGDITAREYQQQLEVLNREERKAELTVHDAEMEARRKDASMRQEWNDTVSDFLDQHGPYKANPRLYRALDQEVRDIAQTPDGSKMTGLQILRQAHKNLVEAGFVKEAAPRRGNKNGQEVPPNLGKVPASEISDTGNNKYAALDRLATIDPIAFEEKLATMSDKERDAYLESN